MQQQQATFQTVIANLEQMQLQRPTFDTVNGVIDSMTLLTESIRNRIDAIETLCDDANQSNDVNATDAIANALSIAKMASKRARAMARNAEIIVYGHSTFYEPKVWKYHEQSCIQTAFNRCWCVVDGVETYVVKLYKPLNVVSKPQPKPLPKPAPKKAMPEPEPTPTPQPKPVPQGKLTDAQKIQVLIDAVDGTQAHIALDAFVNNLVAHAPMDKWFRKRAPKVCHPDRCTGSTALFNVLTSVKEFCEKATDEERKCIKRTLLGGTAEPKQPKHMPTPKAEPKGTPFEYVNRHNWRNEDQILASYYVGADGQYITQTKGKYSRKQFDKILEGFPNEEQHVPLGGLGVHLPYYGGLLRIIYGSKCYYFEMERKSNHRYVRLNTSERIDFSPKRSLQMLVKLCKE